MPFYIFAIERFLSVIQNGVEGQKEILKSIIAVFLLAALLLPSAIEFVHFSDGHEHHVCTDSSEHVHEATPDCSVLHAQLISFHYHLTIDTDLIVPIVPANSVALYAPLVVDSFVRTNTQLRAPPVIS